jgi:hypothetical protein
MGAIKKVEFISMVLNCSYTANIYIAVKCGKMRSQCHCIDFKIHNHAIMIVVADYFKPCLFEKIVYVMNYDLLELLLLLS